MQISKALKAHGVKIDDVAEKLGIRPSSLKQTISKGANPTVETLRKLGDAVNKVLEKKEKAAEFDWREFFDDEFPGNPIKSAGTESQPAKIACPHCGKPLNIHID